MIILSLALINSEGSLENTLQLK